MLYFIVNTTCRSGKGKETWKRIKEELESKGVLYKAYITKGPHHATELAKNITSLPEEELFLAVLGGDGTMNEVIGGITNWEKVRFGMIPLGSGNDFGRGLNLSKDPVENLDLILEKMQQPREACRRIDLGRVSCPGAEPHLFGISAGVGFDAIVCTTVAESKLKKFMNAIHLGEASYIVYTIWTLLSMKKKDAVFTLTDENGTREVVKKDMIFAAAMNLPAEGGGVPMAPNAKPDDGRLILSGAAGIANAATLFYFPFLLAGKQGKIKKFYQESFRKAEIRLSEPMIVHSDGEYVATSDEISLECLPGKLVMMI